MLDLQKFRRKKLFATARESRETQPGGFELTPTHGQVHIPMSTKAEEMCLHATPTVSRAASNDHHMLTFCLLPALEHMEPTDEYKSGQSYLVELGEGVKFSCAKSW